MAASSSSIRAAGDEQQEKKVLVLKLENHYTIREHFSIVLKKDVWLREGTFSGKTVPLAKVYMMESFQENGVLEEYQLAADGIDQARLAGQLFLKAMRENNIGLENVRICYSPFSRTTHTAKVVASLLNIPFEGPQCKYESSKLRHDGPGLLSMAMADRDERGSLFSITFKADHHLDRLLGNIIKLSEIRYYENLGNLSRILYLVMQEQRRL